MKQKATLGGRLRRVLGRANVFRLQAFWSLGHFELHYLAFLQASEAASLNGREMHENVIARLTADEAVAFGVIEPLYRSLFHRLECLFLC